MGTVTNFPAPGVYVNQDADDLALANRCRAGDLGSFEALVQPHQRVLFTISLRILGDDDAAQNRHEPLSAYHRIAGTPADLLESAERRRAVQAAVVALPLDDREAGGDAMTGHESDRQVSQMLDELGPADPPADFTRNVMTRIRNNHVTIHRSHSLSNRKGTAMTRKAMWGLATAAAILLAIFVVRGFPPAGQGTESTIGAAQRYQAPQIAESDVVLGDAAVQEFIQSDTFERAIADPDVRSLLADARIATAMQDRELRRSLLDPEARKALMSADLRRVFDSPELRRALDSQELRRAFDAEFKKATAALQAAEARGGAVTRARSNPNNTQAMWFKATEAALRSAVATDAVKKAVDDAALRRLVEDSAARTALSDPGLRRAIESAAARKALGNDEIRAQMARPNVAAAMNSRAFLDAMGHEAFASALMSRPRQNDLSAQ